MEIERIHWVDIAKGLMIIGMVLNHIPGVCSNYGIDISSFKFGPIGYVYGVFTMQTFFLLSGYTSNFDKGFGEFLKKQIKSLIIPYIFFLPLIFVIVKKMTMEVFGENYLLFVEGYWFLTALFLAKILAYALHRINNQILEWVGGILLLFIGVAINEWYSGAPEPSHYHNWFHYRNGLCMTIFITLGYYLRKSKILSFINHYGIWIAIGYMVIYGATRLLYLRYNFMVYFIAPSYTHYFVPNLNNVNGFLIIPSYLFYTITGSSIVIWFSMLINHCRWLEYLGRKTLIVYCVHFSLLCFYITFLSHYMVVDSLITAMLFFVIIAVVTMTSCAVIAKIFDYKPMMWLLGKF